MKLKNKEIVGMLNSLTGFGNKKLPQKISFAITKNISTLTREYSIYEQEMKKLFERYDSKMMKDESGNIVYDSTGFPKFGAGDGGFKEELNDLLEISVDMDIYYIDENVFDYEDNDNRFDAMSPAEILILQSILCEHK